MNVYRTPDSRFEGLPGYPFRPHYAEFQGLRLHYLDEGEGDPVLLLHGEPSWSYLYRRMIPGLARRFRVVAPDYAGFGRSDKPTEVGSYSYDLHTAAMAALIEQLDLRRIRVVVQDWGGPIGLRLAVEMPERFAGLVVMNTGLFTSKDWPTPGFRRWRAFAEKVGQDMQVGRVIQASVLTELPEDVLQAYEAPWPVRESKAGVAAFPLLVPLSADDPHAAALVKVARAVRRLRLPSLVAWSDQDPVFPLEVGREFARLLPEPVEFFVVEGASHMLQEDRGEVIAERILGWA